MLKLKPNCEHCDCALPPDATNAMICSYECTFCRDCVENTLLNACPNCGGGFEKRPIRPKQEYVTCVSLKHQPASLEPVLKPVDAKAHARFAEAIKNIAPENR